MQNWENDVTETELLLVPDDLDDLERQPLLQLGWRYHESNLPVTWGYWTTKGDVSQYSTAHVTACIEVSYDALCNWEIAADQVAEDVGSVTVV